MNTDDEDGLGFFRGCMVAIPISAIFWVLIGYIAWSAMYR